MPPLVTLEDVGVRYRVLRRTLGGRTPVLHGHRHQELWGLRHAALEIDPGEVVGLIGPNGAGKSTLLRLIAGIYRPDEGRVTVTGRVGPLIALAAGLMRRLSGWQNISLLGVLLGLSREEVQALAPRIAEFSGLNEFLDAEVRTYSSGMRARLAFSVAAFTEPDVLLLDEVLAIGDEEFRRKSAEVVQGFAGEGRAVVVASHNLTELLEHSTRLVWMDRGAVVASGAPQDIASRYRAAGLEDRPGGRPDRVRLERRRMLRRRR